MFYVVQAEEIHWWNDPLGLVIILFLFTLSLMFMVMVRRLWRNGDPKRSSIRRAFVAVCDSLGSILFVGVLVVLGEFLAYSTVTQLMNWAWDDRLSFMVSTGGLLILTLLIMSSPLWWNPKQHTVPDKGDPLADMDEELREAIGIVSSFFHASPEEVIRVLHDETWGENPPH